MSVYINRIIEIKVIDNFYKSYQSSEEMLKDISDASRLIKNCDDYLIVRIFENFETVYKKIYLKDGNITYETIEKPKKHWETVRLLGKYIPIQHTNYNETNGENEIFCEEPFGCINGNSFRENINFSFNNIPLKEKLIRELKTHNNNLPEDVDKTTKDFIESNTDQYSFGFISLTLEDLFSMYNKEKEESDRQLIEYIGHYSNNVNNIDKKLNEIISILGKETISENDKNDEDKFFSLKTVEWLLESQYDVAESIASEIMAIRSIVRSYYNFSYEYVFYDKIRIIYWFE